MKTILLSAYAVNPYKGSEDGTGWNILRQVGQRNRVILITRENNQPALERYLSEHPEPWQQHLQLQYFDLPTWARFWKRGGFGALPYYMLWQMALPRFIRKHGLDFDIAHQLNFHNDWLPTHLWKLGKPVVWGPVGHHPPIPNQYLRPVYGRKAWWADRRRHWIKQGARRLNPWYRKALRRTTSVLTISDAVRERLPMPLEKTHRIPAVGAHPEQKSSSDSLLEPHSQAPNIDPQKDFTILSVGRFVPLKGFDLAIRSFARFVQRLPKAQQDRVRLCLVGRGPEKERLMEMARETGQQDRIDFVEWMPQQEFLNCYRKASVFLFPSHEGAGMVVPEALSFGLPVICFDNAGPGELINPACGIRISHGPYEISVNAFANALEALHSKASLREQMSQAARAHVDDHLSWNAKGDAIQQIYDSIALT